MDPDTLQFHAVLSQAATRTETALAGFLPGEETTLGAAMRYAVLSGGKRLRAFLALESAAIFRVPPAQAIRAAAAVECIHAYSLVHDDLPCMDDDDLRRGKPTVHVAWDEATAVLVGDGLQALAFEILAAPQSGIEPRIQTRLVLRLAQAAGPAGMVGGQAFDIAAEKAARPLGLEEIGALQALKTGALFGWAAESGAILGRSDPGPLGRYAAALGRAFQIRDDILDAEGDAQAAGKRLGKDGERNKATFVSLLGLDGARERAAALVAEACEALVPYGSAATNLRLAAQFALARSA
jgi:farnesyl diphosphate synthase